MFFIGGSQHIVSVSRGEHLVWPPGAQSVLLIFINIVLEIIVNHVIFLKEK